jgi:hypothetical protein
MNIDIIVLRVTMARSLIQALFRYAFLSSIDGLGEAKLETYIQSDKKT